MTRTIFRKSGQIRISSRKKRTRAPTGGSIRYDGQRSATLVILSREDGEGSFSHLRRGSLPFASLRVGMTG